MTVTIYNAISLDGYISGQDKYESWISEVDEKNFNGVCTETEMIIMGSNTYDLNPELYPVPNKENVVFTQSAETRESVAGIIYTNQDPISFIREHTNKKILVTGGGQLNSTLLKSKIVTDIIVTVHPIILGDGIKQFSTIDHTAETKLEKIHEEDIGEGVTLIHYKVCE